MNWRHCRNERKFESNMAGIYFHIPFCRQACHYCDFHFSTQTDIRQELLKCMTEEMAYQQHFLGGETIQTVYFGGGTPSMLTGDEVAQLLAPVFRLFTVAADAEVTLEANPDDLTPARLATFKAVGINR